MHGSDKSGKMYSSLIYSGKKFSVSCEPRSETKLEKNIHIPKIFKFPKEISNYSMTSKNSTPQIKRLSTLSPVPLKIVELKGKKKSETLSNFHTPKLRKDTSLTKKRIKTIDRDQFTSPERPRKKISLNTISKYEHLVPDFPDYPGDEARFYYRNNYPCIESIKCD